MVRPNVTTAPPLRVAWHLLRARENAGLTVRDAAEAAGVALIDLDDVEHGRRTVTEDELERLSRAYGIADHDLVPPRTPVEIDGVTGRMHIGGHEGGVGESDGDALASYLALVYRARGAKAGDRVQLRDDDLDVLASLIGDDPDDIEARLIELMDCTPEEARNLGAILFWRRVLGSAAAVILGIAGVVALGGDGDRDARAAASGAPTSPTEQVADPGVGEIGTSAFLEQASAPAVAPPAAGPAAGGGVDGEVSQTDGGSPELADWPDTPDLLVNVPTDGGFDAGIDSGNGGGTVVDQPVVPGVDIDVPSGSDDDVSGGNGDSTGGDSDADDGVDESDGKGKDKTKDDDADDGDNGKGDNGGGNNGGGNNGGGNNGVGWGVDGSPPGAQ